MSILEVTSRITPKWLERKSKAELVSIIWKNLDRIDLFATASPLEWHTDPNDPRYERKLGWLIRDVASPKRTE